MRGGPDFRPETPISSAFYAPVPRTAMSFIPPIAGLLSMGNNFRLVLLACSLSVGFMSTAGAETRPVVLEVVYFRGL